MVSLRNSASGTVNVYFEGFLESLMLEDSMR